MQQNVGGCEKLLSLQLQHCEDTLTSAHPLAAKMLAVMARLHLKRGDEAECEVRPRLPEIT